MGMIRGLFTNTSAWAINPSSLLTPKTPVTLIERVRKSFDEFLNWVGCPSDFFKENKIVVCVRSLSWGYSDVKLVELHGLIKQALIQKLGSNHQETNDKRVAEYAKCVLKTEVPKAIFEEASKRLDTIYQITFLYKHGKKVALGTAGLLAAVTTVGLRHYHRFVNQNLTVPNPHVPLPSSHFDVLKRLYSECINNHSSELMLLGGVSVATLSLCYLIRKIRSFSTPTDPQPRHPRTVNRSQANAFIIPDEDGDLNQRLQDADNSRNRAQRREFQDFYKGLYPDREPLSFDETEASDGSEDSQPLTEIPETAADWDAYADQIRARMGAIELARMRGEYST